MFSPQSPQTLQEEHGCEVVADSQPQITIIEEEPLNQNHRDNPVNDKQEEEMNKDPAGFTSHVNPSEIRKDSHPYFFNQAGKRVIKEENLISDRNKRLRINDSWENQNRREDFGMCVDDFQQTLSSLRMFYQQKQKAIEESRSATRILIDELQRKDNAIEHLKKTTYEEAQKKNEKIHRYEKELSFMGDVLDGYRKAVKAAQKEFAEYREKVGLPEEEAYKVAGPGGLMLSVGEIERNRKKQEEEFKNIFLVFKHECKKIEERFAGQFDLFSKRVNILNEKLVGLECDVKELLGLYAERKVPQIDVVEGSSYEVSEPQSDEFEEHPGGENVETISEEIAEITLPHHLLNVMNKWF